MNKNVLILALSVFSKYDKDSKSYRPDKSETTDGDTYYYQLEPVPRMLIKRLKEAGQQLDTVIMMCTQKTTEKATVNIEGQETLNISPCEYFKDAIIKYDCQVNNSSNSLIEFVDIKLDEAEPHHAITGVVNEIRKIRDSLEEPNMEVVVHVDTHGGFRSIQTITEAILYLLEIEQKIIISQKNIWELKYTNGKSVIENDKAIKIFNLVAGIKEFLNSGRVDVLRDVIGEEDPLFKCLNKISTGIRLCSVVILENGLNELYEFYRTSCEISDMYLSIFYDEIRSEYADLLTNTRSVFDELKWCFEKGYYQQCLTFIEAAMPEYYRKKNVTYFSNEAFNAIVTHKSVHFDGNNYVYNSINNLDIRDGILQYMTNSDPGNRSRKDIKVVFNGQKAVELQSRHKELKGIRNKVNHLDRRTRNIEELNVISMIKSYIDFIRDNIENSDISESWIKVEINSANTITKLLLDIKNDMNILESDLSGYDLTENENKLIGELKMLYKCRDETEYVNAFFDGTLDLVKMIMKIWIHDNSGNVENLNVVRRRDITREQVEKKYKKNNGKTEGFEKLINWISSHPKAVISCISR